MIQTAEQQKNMRPAPAPPGRGHRGRRRVQHGTANTRETRGKTNKKQARRDKQNSAPLARPLQQVLVNQATHWSHLGSLLIALRHWHPNPEPSGA